MCRRAWCGKCYTPPAALQFYIHQAENDVSLVWKRKEDKQKFKWAPDGAFLLVPFQCDYCWFENLKGRAPHPGSACDIRLLGYIRRVNLDLCWSRSPATFASNRIAMQNLISSWKELALEPNLPALGPWPLEDNVGFQLALGELRYSQKPGKNKKSHLQFDTIRKLRTAHAHYHESTATSASNQTLAFRDSKGNAFLASEVPTQSRFFTMFMRGLLLRMGRQTEVDFGLDYNILHMILDNLEEEIEDGETDPGRRRWCIMVGNFLLLGFVLSLRGNEGFMVEAHGLQSHRDCGRSEGRDSHVVIPLLGRFKNEDGERWHLMVAAAETSSGFKVRQWVDLLVEVLRRERRKEGPAFCKEDGTMISPQAMDAEFVKQLQKVQEIRPDLIAPSIDVGQHYSIFRSLRRGSTARARDQKVDKDCVDVHNRWRTMERTSGQRSKASMRDYYTDLKLTLNLLLEYSRAL